MEPVMIVLFLLFAVVVSGLLSRMLPLAIPRPLVQIALGVVIGLVAHLRVELDPEIFFLLFLPPLLFLDGWRIPNDELLRTAERSWNWRLASSCSPSSALACSSTR